MGINTRLDNEGKKISNLENIAVEIIQNETEDRIFFKWKENLWSGNNFK